MPDQTTEAASSPAEAVDVFNGEEVSLSELNTYRETGELPARFKAVTESAPDDAQEETEETEGESLEPSPDSDPDEEQQEPKPQTKRDKRIQQLLEETKELKRKLAEKQDVKTEPSTAPEATRPKPKVDDKNVDGSARFKEYEDYVEELADWKAEQRIEAERRAIVQRERDNALLGKLEDAKTRYDDAEDVIFPANKTINESNIPLAVKQVLFESELVVDVFYVIGSEEGGAEKFIALAQSNPRAAIGKVFEYERGIREELSKQSESRQRDGEGKFVAPETKKTAAPKPPSPVGGTSSRAFDVNDDSLSPEEWAKQRTKQLQQR